MSAERGWELPLLLAGATSSPTPFIPERAPSMRSRCRPLGYAHRVAHPEDQRAALVKHAPLGEEMLALSAQIFGRIHAKIAERLGKGRAGGIAVTLAASAVKIVS